MSNEAEQVETSKETKRRTKDRIDGDHIIKSVQRWSNAMHAFPRDNSASRADRTRRHEFMV